MHTHSVKYNFIMNMILKVSSLIFPLITLPYITRTLGATQNGKIEFATSIVSYFLMLAQLGIPTYGVRACAKCRDDKNKLTKTVHELLFINCISCLFSYVLLIFATIYTYKFYEYRLLIMIQSISLLMNMLGMEWFYQAIEQYQYITVRNIIFKFVGIVMMFCLIHNPDDYLLYCGITVFCSCGSYLLNFIYGRHILNHKLYLGKYEIKKHLKPIFIFFALSIAVSIYANMDTVMLGFMSNDKEVAFYAIATKIKIILAMVISSLGPVLLPRIVYYLSVGQKEKFEYYLEKSIHFVLIISGALVGYFFFMANVVIKILGGDEYMDAVPIMRVIMLALIPLGIGNIVCNQVLTPLGKEKYIMYSTIVGACINLVFNLFLIPIFGALGATIATVITETVVAGIQLFHSRDNIIIVFKKLQYLKILSAVSIALIILNLTKYYLHANDFIQIVITFSVYIIAYFSLLLIFKDSFVCNYFKIFVNRIRK